MAICTLADLKADPTYVADGSTDDQLRTLLGSLTDLMEEVLNRGLTHAVESISVDEINDTATLIVAGHGFAEGDEVDITTRAGNSPIEGQQVITSVVDEHQFKIAFTGTSADLAEHPEYTARRVLLQRVNTHGSHSLFIDPRPVAEVLEVSIGDTENDSELLDASEYFLAEIHRGVSYTGELFRSNQEWPKIYTRTPTVLWKNKPQPRIPMPSGVRIKYIVGEPFVPQALVTALVKTAIATPKRQEIEGFGSVSYDYYSVSRISSTEIGQLFGESEYILKKFRLPVM